VSVLLHERLHRGQERGDRDTREDERRRRPPGHGAAEEVGGSDADHRACERREGPEIAARRFAVGVGDHQRRTEPGAGRRAQEIRVGKRIAEDTLVGSARRGEHCSDQEPECDPRHPDLPEDRVLRLRERGLHVQERDVAQKLACDRPDAEVDGTRREGGE
jgi:hypothetical protein